MEIKINSISKTFQNNTVLNDLTYQFDENTNYRIIGPNGAGKTTLFKVMIGILEADGGSLEYDLKTDHESRLGWVPSSEIGLFGRLTGKENLDVLTRLLVHHDQNELNLQLGKWNEIKAFREGMETQFFKCSSGMKQLLKMFCAMIHKPETMIMDEPFRNLDIETRQLISKILSETEFIKSIIFSDHFYQENILEDAKSLELKEGKLFDFNEIG